MVLRILNLEGCKNCIIGSKVTMIFTTFFHPVNITSSILMCLLRELAGKVCGFGCWLWQVPGDMWHKTCDIWHVTCDMWHLTHDMWLVTLDTWQVIYIYLFYRKCQKGPKIILKVQEKVSKMGDFIVTVLLSTLVERVSVSRIGDLFFKDMIFLCLLW